MKSTSKFFDLHEVVKKNCSKASSSDTKALKMNKAMGTITKS